MVSSLGVAVSREASDRSQVPYVPNLGPVVSAPEIKGALTEGRKGATC